MKNELFEIELEKKNAIIKELSETMESMKSKLCMYIVNNLRREAELMDRGFAMKMDDAGLFYMGAAEKMKQFAEVDLTEEDDATSVYKFCNSVPDELLEVFNGDASFTEAAEKSLEFLEKYNKENGTSL